MLSRSTCCALLLCLKISLYRASIVVSRVFVLFFLLLNVFSPLLLHSLLFYQYSIVVLTLPLNGWKCASLCLRFSQNRETVYSQGEWFQFHFSILSFVSVNHKKSKAKFAIILFFKCFALQRAMLFRCSSPRDFVLFVLVCLLLLDYNLLPTILSSGGLSFPLIF